MSDADIVRQAVADFHDHGRISNGQARVIASQWHGGQASALYSLTSCGAINVTKLTREIEANLHRRNDQSMIGELAALLGYVHHHGERGPVEGWSKLWW